MSYQNAEWLIKRYQQAQTLRSPLEQTYRMLAAYCMPQEYSHWLTNTSQPGGTLDMAAARRLSYDSKAKQAVPKFATICHRLATPKTQKWHKLVASEPKLMKSSRVRNYFDELNDLLFKRRYDPKSRFSSAQTENYAMQGVYGTGIKYIAQRRKTPLVTQPGISYRSVSLRDIFFLVDVEGNIDVVFRRMFLSARQAEQQFGSDNLTPKIRAELAKPDPSETKVWEFIHVVLPRDDYMAEAMDARRFPLASCYVAVEEKCFVKEHSGYSTWPYVVARHFTGAASIYGISPAMFAIDAIGSASAMKKTLLKAGQKAVEPTLLAHDDGIVNGALDMRPGAVNYGGVDAQGRRLVQALEVGNVQIGLEMLQEERADIDDAFFVKLFQILVDTPEMTATEVMERVAEKSALLAPTMERMQSEDLGPTIERELDLLAQMKMLPEMPPEMIEAKGDYEVIYTSPLAKSQNAESISGFTRIVEMAVTAAQATQDATPLRRINFDAAIPEIGDYLSVPSRWLHSDDEMAEINDKQDQRDQVEQLSQAAPAIAGIMKAGAVTQQAGAGQPKAR